MNTGALIITIAGPILLTGLLTWLIVSIQKDFKRSDKEYEEKQQEQKNTIDRLLKEQDDKRPGEDL